MPFALLCVKGSAVGRWFIPNLEEKWSETQPTKVGNGVYSDHNVAGAVAKRLLGYRANRDKILEVREVVST